MKKINKDNDLNNYLFNRISDIEIRLAYSLQEKNKFENTINNNENFENKLMLAQHLKELKYQINFFKGMLKAYHEILSLSIGEDVRKL